MSPPQSSKITSDRQIFVIMPFGTKLVGEGRDAHSVDFDLIYDQLLRPAGQEAGCTVTRIDEVAAAGMISDQYLQRLFEASIVIADVSTPNANVYYELGIRHAISTGLTVLTALAGTRLPFDIAHLRVMFYSLETLGTARTALVKALSVPRELRAAGPVRGFLQKLGSTTNPSEDSAGFAQELAGRIQRAKTQEQLVGIWAWVKNLAPLPALALLPLAERLADHGEWAISVDVLRAAIQQRPEDFEIHRQLGWHLRHLGQGHGDEALQELQMALELNPNDPETLGMIGGLHKRQRAFDRAASAYAAAAAAAPSSLYVQVNHAAMALLADPDQPAEGLKLYASLLRRLEEDPDAASDAWAEVVAGEAAFALGQDATAVEHFRRAQSLTRSGRELKSAAEQIQLIGSVGFRSRAAQEIAAVFSSLTKRRVLESSGPPVAASVSDKVVNTPVLLHLSDLHFGTRPGASGPVDMHRFRPGDYEKSLSEHLRGEFTSKRAHFDHDHARFYLIVSGDLTYQGTEEEFRLAETFLTQVCDFLQIGRSRVVLIPGNHDVHWPSSKIDANRRFDNYLAFVERFYGADLFRSLYPLVNWDFRIDSPRPSPAEILSIHRAPGFAIIGMNSCVYETEQHHYGFMGGRQLDNIQELLDKADGSTTDFRVAVIHHQLHPFPEPVSKSSEHEIWMDLSTIRDAGLVERRLEKLGFDLVLHGHKHKPQLRETLVRDPSLSQGDVDRLIVCGAGSAGVNASELEHSVPNHYELIEVLRLPRTSGAELLSIEWRELGLHAGAEWTTSRRWVLPG